MGNTVSVFKGTTPRRRRVASDAITGPGQRIILDIAKENIQKEHTILFDVSLANVGAPTAVNLARLGKIVQSIVFRVAGPQGGELVNCSGLTAHLLTSTQEEEPGAITPFAAPQLLQFAIELHHENLAAIRALMTALNGDRATGIALEITIGTLADFRSLAGGPYVAAAAFTGITGTVDIIVNESAPRDLVAIQGVATGRHFIREKFEAFAGAGQTTVLLEVGNRTRGLLLSCETAVAIGSDTLISNISLQIKGETILDFSWFAGRMETISDTTIDEPGIVWISFSEDDEAGFLDLYNTNQAHLVVTTTGAGQVRVLQDYTENLPTRG